MSGLTDGPLSPWSPLSPEGPGTPCKLNAKGHYTRNGGKGISSLHSDIAANKYNSLRRDHPN